jgi:hypothetical protein
VRQRRHGDAPLAATAASSQSKWRHSNDRRTLSWQKQAGRSDHVIAELRA